MVLSSLFRTYLPALAGAAAAAIAASPSRATEFKLGHVYDVSHPMHKAAVEAAAAFKACTGGRHSIAVYPSSQLGSENAINEQVQFGGIDIVFTGQIFASSTYKPLAIGAAPFIFKDVDQALRYRTSAIFKELWEGWGKATGQHILSAGYFGAFNVTSNTPVEKPEDMKGLRFASPTRRSVSPSRARLAPIRRRSRSPRSISRCSRASSRPRRIRCRSPMRSSSMKCRST